MLTKNLTLSKREQVLQEVGKVVLVGFLVAFLGKLTVPLPGTPIPMALRPQLVIFLAWLFGTRVTSCGVLLFLLGAHVDVGLLVTASTFTTTLFGPTCGYLFAYLVVAVLAPKMRERGIGLVSSFLLLSITIDLLGALGLSLFVGISQGFFLGFFPFVLGDSIKALFFAKMTQRFLAK